MLTHRRLRTIALIGCRLAAGHGEPSRVVESDDLAVEVESLEPVGDMRERVRVHGEGEGHRRGPWQVTWFGKVLLPDWITEAASFQKSLEVVFSSAL